MMNVSSSLSITADRILIDNNDLDQQQRKPLVCSSNDTKMYNRRNFGRGGFVTACQKIGMVVVSCSILLVLASPCKGAIQSMEGIVLHPNPFYIQYDEGYIRKSGTIDLSDLIFEAKTIMDGSGGSSADDDKWLSNVDDDTSTDDFIDNDDDDDDESALERLKKSSDDDNESDEVEISNDDDDNDDDDGSRRKRQRQRKLQKFFPLPKPSVGSNSISVSGATTTFNGTVIDIAIFAIPSYCARGSATCPWTDLGVGKIADAATTSDKSSVASSDGTNTNNNNNKLYWCCNDQAVMLGLCTESSNNYGRLLIDDSIYNGQRRMVSIPYKSSTGSKNVKAIVDTNSIIDIMDGSHTYVILYANCAVSSTSTSTKSQGGKGNNNINTIARTVTVHGDTVWRSVHGFLPGELYGFQLFYFGVTIVYLLLLVWFVSSMCSNTTTRIDIEYYIATAIVVGSIEMIFRSLDYIIWNEAGTRSIVIIWMGILSGVWKEAFARCVLVMVCLGYTVSRNSLANFHQNCIFITGFIYIITSTTSDCLLAVATKNINTLSYRQEIVLVDTASILSGILTILNIGFVVAMMVSITNTIHYLERIGETAKLQRTKHLRSILTASAIFIAIGWIINVFMTYYSNELSILIQEEYAWMKDAMTELNYILVLIGISILWKPNERAHDYTYVLKKLDTNSRSNHRPITDSPTTSCSDHSGNTTMSAGADTDEENGEISLTKALLLHAATKHDKNDDEKTTSVVVDPTNRKNNRRGLISRTRSGDGMLPLINTDAPVPPVRTKSIGRSNGTAAANNSNNYPNHPLIPTPGTITRQLSSSANQRNHEPSRREVTKSYSTDGLVRKFSP